MSKFQRHRISPTKRRFVLERDGHACAKCGETRDLTIDHIRPVSKNGSSKTWNLQTLCQRCNEAKADADPPRDPGPPDPVNRFHTAYA